MLVLTRYVDEDVIVTLGGEEVTVRVQEIQHGKRVRLGFIASRAVTVHRKEVAARIAEELKEKEPASAPC